MFNSLIIKEMQIKTTVGYTSQLPGMSFKMTDNNKH